MQKNDKIKIMPEELASQIAAGEVVERPASVVKELVENSLDAGATSIEVEVSLKRRRIRVKDNGRGIESSDVELALSRHGSSKVYEKDDIFGIGSFGFRGEALPSIASVSRLTLKSHRLGSKAGAEIIVEGGKRESLTQAPSINGTEVLVENLFYNTPARRKFTRADATEMTYITSSVIQSALSFPDLRLTFIKEKKRVLELSPAKNLSERVRQIFGAEYADQLVEVDHKDGIFHVTGLLGKPGFNRATTIDQHFFVNGRPVKDVLIRGAVGRAYSDLMPKGRKPVLFLKIEMPLNLVDVNVHPTKAEVRFAEPGRVSSLIVTAIRKSLGKNAVPFFAQTQKDFGGTASSINQTSEATILSNFTGKEPEGFKRSFQQATQPFRDATERNEPVEEQAELTARHGRLSKEAVPLGQFLKTFLVIEEGEKLLILDQHTVHERILFERFMNRFLSSSVERQKLLITQTIEADPAKAELLRSHLKTLGSLGWVLEDFGEKSFALREVPSLLVGKDYSAIIHQLAETIEGNRDIDFKEMLSHLVATMACRAAVKAGDVLTSQEITSMIEELGRTELPYTCPHGRPVALEVTKDMLYKDFGRAN